MEHAHANQFGQEYRSRISALNWLLVICLLLTIPFLSSKLSYLSNYYLLAILLLFSVVIIVSIFIGYSAPRADKMPQALQEKHLIRLNGDGLTDTEVRKRLLFAYWHPHAIELVFNDLHNPNGSMQKMQAFINHQLRKGKFPEEVKEMLLDAKWPEVLVDLGLF